MDTDLFVLIFSESSHHVTSRYHLCGVSIFTADGERMTGSIQESIHKTSGNFPGERNNVQGSFCSNCLFEEVGHALGELIQVAVVTGALAAKDDTVLLHTFDFKFEVTATGLVVGGVGGGIIVEDRIISIERQHGAVILGEFIAGSYAGLGSILAIGRDLLSLEHNSHIASSIVLSGIVGENPAILVGRIGEEGTHIRQIVLHALGRRRFKNVGLVLEAGSKGQQGCCHDYNGIFQFHIHFLHC